LTGCFGKIIRGITHVNIAIGLYSNKRFYLHCLKKLLALWLLISNTSMALAPAAAESLSARMQSLVAFATIERDSFNVENSEQ
jgi:hypothetical protein